MIETTPWCAFCHPGRPPWAAFRPPPTRGICPREKLLVGWGDNSGDIRMGVTPGSIANQWRPFEVAFFWRVHNPIPETKQCKKMQLHVNLGLHREDLEISPAQNLFQRNMVGSPVASFHYALCKFHFCILKNIFCKTSMILIMQKNENYAICISPLLVLPKIQPAGWHQMLVGSHLGHYLRWV